MDKYAKYPSFIEDLIKHIKNNKAKLLGLSQFKHNILEELAKFDSKDYETWNFQDIFHIVRILTKT